MANTTRLSSYKWKRWTDIDQKSMHEGIVTIPFVRFDGLRVSFLSPLFSWTAFLELRDKEETVNAIRLTIVRLKIFLKIQLKQSFKSEHHPKTSLFSSSITVLLEKNCSWKCIRSLGTSSKKWQRRRMHVHLLLQSNLLQEEVFSSQDFIFKAELF